MEELGGEIRVTSQEGKGSRFLVVLPLEIPLLQAEEYNEKNKELTLSSSGVKLPSDELVTEKFSFITNAMPGESTSGNVRILLVEDNIVAQQIAELILTDLGYQVQIADCGKKAIELFSQNKYDLAFIDIGLPDVSGHFVIEEIRKIENGKASLPIIVLTAHATYDIEKNGPNLGIQETLSKPLCKEKAKKVVERYVVNSCFTQV